MRTEAPAEQDDRRHPQRIRAVMASVGTYTGIVLWSVIGFLVCKWIYTTFADLLHVMLWSAAVAAWWMITSWGKWHVDRDAALKRWQAANGDPPATPWKPPLPFDWWAAFASGVIFGGLAVGILFVIFLALALVAWLLSFAGVDPSWLDAVGRFARGIYT